VSDSARIARNTAVQVAGEIISRAALLGLYVVMAREFGTSGFGEFTFALSLSLVLVFSGGLGIDEILARAVARRPDDIDRLFWNALTVKLLLGGAAVVVATVVAILGDFSSSLRLAIVILALAALVEILTQTIYAAFQGLGDLLPEAMGLMIQRVCRAAAGLVVVIAGLGVDAVALVYLGGALASLVYVSATLARRAGPQLSLSLETSRALVLTALPIGFSLIFEVIHWRVDAVILAALKDDTAVGLYGAAARLIETPLFLSAAFVAALVPVLSRLTPTTNPPAVQVYEAGLKILTAGLTPVAACFVVFAEPLMRLFYGGQFTEAASATRLLGGTILLLGLAQLSLNVLISQDRQRIIPWIAAAVSVENIGLNFLLIPHSSF
jgi:O-antigen/teichoic acid export membrane protein